ncbi:uncharacterized protein [Temnothorax nylanderi]|uniref:uncharacterized protein n=1 Tax=Temnothorax nylanderi TaxID=102681 RepID=UPI003A856317
MTERRRKSRKFSHCSNMTRRGSRSFIQICAYLAFITVTIAADQEECDKTKCPGPLAYYEALGCTPVFEKEGDCCATKYNCDHLKERSTIKCYVNGKEYEIGEKLKDEDANPCDVSCTCLLGRDGNASFNCAIVDCFHGPVKPENDNDAVIHNESGDENPDDKDVCHFGNLTMQLGDELNQSTDYSSACVKCVCEVPPVPTCQRLPDDECDVTKQR